MGTRPVRSAQENIWLKGWKVRALIKYTSPSDGHDPSELLSKTLKSIFGFPNPLEKVSNHKAGIAGPS
jgi:hypothetical protein